MDEFSRIGYGVLMAQDKDTIRTQNRKAKVAERQRLAAEGYRHTTVALPAERLAILDRFKAELGVASRGEALSRLLAALDQEPPKGLATMREGVA